MGDWHRNRFHRPQGPRYITPSAAAPPPNQHPRRAQPQQRQARRLRNAGAGEELSAGGLEGGQFARGGHRAGVQGALAEVLGDGAKVVIRPNEGIIINMTYPPPQFTP